MTFAAASQAANPSWIDMLTLILAGVGAIGGIAAALIAARSATRREWAAWLRQEQARTCKEFHRAMEGSHESVIHPINAAMKKPDKAGLGKARKAALASGDKLSLQLMDMAVYAPSDTNKAAVDVGKLWLPLLSQAAPLPGCGHHTADVQRQWCVSILTSLSLIPVWQMRIDLGIASAEERRRSPKSLDELRAIIKSHAADLVSDARKTLADWEVQRWSRTGLQDPEITLGYGTNDKPWGDINATHPEFLQPLAAVLRKPKKSAWMLAIEESLPAQTIAQIERDAVAVVTNHGKMYESFPFGKSACVEVETPGENLYFWTRTWSALHAARCYLESIGQAG